MMFDRLRAAAPFVTVGTACVVAGGCMSAAIALAPTERGAWAVAYLVLVAGVAQAVLGAGQGWLAVRVPSWRVLAVELALWNVGNAAVLAGSMSGLVVLVGAGGAMLVAALICFVAYTGGAFATARWSLLAFRIVAVLLAVSIPIGVVLSALRPA